MKRPPIDVDAFTNRLLLDLWLDATASYWERRARQLEAARPTPADLFHGNASPRELNERWQELTDAAQACRNRAAFLDGSRTELDNTLDDLTDQEHAA